MSSFVVSAAKHNQNCHLEYNINLWHHYRYCLLPMVMITNCHWSISVMCPEGMTNWELKGYINYFGMQCQINGIDMDIIWTQHYEPDISTIVVQFCQQHTDHMFPNLIYSFIFHYDNSAKVFSCWSYDCEYVLYTICQRYFVTLKCLWTAILLY